VMIISDTNVFPLYGEKVCSSLQRAGKTVETVVIKAGESSKTLQQTYRIIKDSSSFKMERQDTILTLGGGVVSDIGGFVASVYLRGINFVAVPTTLLSHVDAAIGGKTAVNLPWGKNLVGSFYQPGFVYIDTGTLATLPDKEIKQGIAEIIKYGVIKNKKIFEVLEKSSLQETKRNLRWLVEESIKIKKQVVEKDERETKGIRETLNFGHTIGHAIEIKYNKKFNHGQAVAIGMVWESLIGTKLGITPVNVYKRIKSVVKKYGFALDINKTDKSLLMDAITYDKKTRNGAIRCSLPERIGKTVCGIEVTAHAVQKTWEEFRHESGDK